MHEYSTNPGVAFYNAGMPRRLARLTPFFPAALLLLWSGWAGTFAGGADGVWAMAGQAALLALLVAAGPSWRDPLRLGRGGNLLLVALAGATLASWLASPVPRAGRTALVLAPAMVLLPAAAARCWFTAARRKAGLAALSVTVAGVAGWALVGLWRFGEPAALPLGHHNLLAAWLVTLLPPALLPWRDGGAGRVLAAVAGALVVGALLATGSLGAALAVLVVASGALLAARGTRRWWWVAGLLLLVLGSTQASRIQAILAGDDASARARWGYLAAGWRGVAERPALGWGPGAARWTIGHHLRPVPGVHPPDQVVGDLHALPLDLAYELGIAGVALAVGVGLVFLRRRLREMGSAADPALLRAALLGLAALAVASALGLPLAVGALPLAALTAAGAALAAAGPPRRQTTSPWPARALALGAALLLVPTDLAHLAYDRAVDAEDPRQQVRHLERAVALDPSLPLYRARLAWLEAELRGVDAELARQARDAARDASGLAPLWLAAGAMGREAGAAWARPALLEACRLNPLGALAPYQLALLPRQRHTVEWAGRALLAEPRLLAAVGWRGRPWVEAAAHRLSELPGVGPGWRLALLERHEAGRVAGGPTRTLALTMDGEAAASLSLFAFRRRPWPVHVARVELYADALPRIDMVPVTVLPGTAAEVFQAAECGLGGGRPPP